MTLYLRAVIFLLISGALALSHLTAYRKGRADVRRAWDAAKVVQEREAQAQTARNIELQRAAERRYVVQQEGREKFIVTTVRELSREASPLSACPVPTAVRVRLNAIRSCALGDPAASCGADGAVPSP